MKNIFVILFLISAQQTCNQTNSLPVIKTTSQQWAGGAAGSGYGTYYRIYVKMKQSSDFQFDSLWVNKKRIRIEMNSGTDGSDTLILTANDFIRGTMHGQPDASQQQDTISIPMPIKTNAQGVLGYFYKGKRMYYSVENWTALKAVYYR